MKRKKLRKNEHSAMLKKKEKHIFLLNKNKKKVKIIKQARRRQKNTKKRGLFLIKKVTWLVRQMLKLGHWSSWGTGDSNFDFAQLQTGAMVKLGHRCFNFELAPIPN